MINDEYIAYAAFWGFNPFSPHDTGTFILPPDTKCHFCQEGIDGMEMYMIIMELATYAHIGCVEKVLDKI